MPDDAAAMTGRRTPAARSGAAAAKGRPLFSLTDGDKRIGRAFADRVSGADGSGDNNAGVQAAQAQLAATRELTNRHAS
jgi:hypothetical protein